jgi:glycosyl transferase family 2
MSPLERVSIILEWENARLSEADRAAAMLEQVFKQVSASTSSGLNALERRDFELLVLYDQRLIPEAVVRDALDGARRMAAVEGTLGQLDVRLIATDSLPYYRLKNEGARQARGSIIVFIDSDVIPEARWLDATLSAFDDPQVHVVAGNSYIGARTIYEKAFALGWFFQLRADDGPLAEGTRFFANNVAFRREAFVRFGFPDETIRSRGQCRTLARALTDHGVRLWYNPRARVAHPPPNGVVHFVRRALSQGADDVLTHIMEGAAPRSGVRFTAGSGVRRCVDVVRHRRRVDLGPVDAAAAAGVMAVYYSLSVVGAVIASVAPNFVRRRFGV